MLNLNIEEYNRLIYILHSFMIDEKMKQIKL